MKKKKMVLAGGSGFIGQYLATYFAAREYEITILSRGHAPPNTPFEYKKWDGKTLNHWQGSLEGAEVLINLAGKSVDCRYTPENKAKILSSRIESTQVLGEAVLSCSQPPKLWLNSSTATIYRNSVEDDMTEEKGELGDGFSENVAISWEREFFDFDLTETRQIAMRMSFILGDGSAMRPLTHLCKWGLGGKQGSGKQYVSWLHIEDLSRMIEYFIENSQLEGAFNCSSPNPLPNKDFMKGLRKQLGVPFGLPANQWMLELGAIFLQTETELILKSRRVVPKKLMDAGFQLIYPLLEEALEELLSNKKRSPTKAPSI